MFLRSKVTILVLLALFLGLVITAYNIWQLAELQRQHFDESARARGGVGGAGTGLTYALYAKHPDSGFVRDSYWMAVTNLRTRKLSPAIGNSIASPHKLCMFRIFETCLECSWKSWLHQSGHEHHPSLGCSVGARLPVQEDQREDACHQTRSKSEQVPWVWLHH